MTKLYVYNDELSIKEQLIVWDVWLLNKNNGHLQPIITGEFSRKVVSSILKIMPA